MLLFLSLFPFLVMTGIEPRASRMLDKCSITELQSQPFRSFSIESFSFLKEGRSQWENPRFCSRRTKSNPVPYLGKPSQFIAICNLTGGCEGLCFGTEKLQTLRCYMEKASYIKKRQLSCLPFQKNLQFL